MPAPNPLLPSDIQWGYRSGVERHSFRITTAAAQEDFAIICSGSKRILALNVMNISTPLGANATISCLSLTSLLLGGQVVISAQALPVTAAQYVPNTTHGSRNIAATKTVIGVQVMNPDTDALDLLCELVWVPAADSSNTAIDSQASVTAMTFP